MRENTFAYILNADLGLGPLIFSPVALGAIPPSLRELRKYTPQRDFTSQPVSPQNQTPLRSQRGLFLWLSSWSRGTWMVAGWAGEVARTTSTQPLLIIRRVTGYTRLTKIRGNFPGRLPHPG